MSLDVQIARVAELLTASERVVVLTGAGISTESGIPDFRGPSGLWTKNPGAEKLATLEVYMSDPEARARAWQARLTHQTWEAKPNAGHMALVELEHRDRLETLITQNIDGLHQLAGNSAARVIEIHGTLRDVVCMRCHERRPMETALFRVRAGERDPACLRCGGILKSATISFGQALVAADLQRAENAARSCDLFLAIGSSLSVFPIAAVVPIAKQVGAQVVIINGAPTDMDVMADVVVNGQIGTLLPRILRESATFQHV